MLNRTWRVKSSESGWKRRYILGKDVYSSAVMIENVVGKTLCFPHNSTLKVIRVYEKK